MEWTCDLNLTLPLLLPHSSLPRGDPIELSLSFADHDLLPAKG